MFDRIIRVLARAARRTSATYVLALGASIAAACTWSALAWHFQSAATRAPSKAGAASPNVAGLDALRRQAAGGDERSNLELSSTLMDRYDASGNVGDLFEALEWIDRLRDISDLTRQTGRVLANYCRQRVVQWHRLCVQGE